MSTLQTAPFPSLTFERYTFHLRLDQNLFLPAFPGTLFRGGFGYAFRRTACLRPNQECRACLLASTCPYAYVFETIHPVDEGREIPHPFVLQPPPGGKAFQAGAEISLGVVLVGRGTAYLPHFIYAFQELGRMGLGQGRNPFTLLQVHEALSGTQVYTDQSQRLREPGPSPEAAAIQAEVPPGEAITVEMVTPLRLRQGGVELTSLDFPVFFGAAVRRLRALSYFHCGGERNLAEKERYFLAAGALRALWEGGGWREQCRYSTRQRVFMPMGGLMGRFLLEGDLASVWPILRLAERLHVGKASSFGLGRFRLV